MVVTRTAERAWPELFAGRPVILYSWHPAASPLLTGDGWAGPHEPDQWELPHPGWSAALDGPAGHLVVHRPGGALWFDGPFAATREWRRAARNHRAVLQVTGPFTNPLEFPEIARRGELDLVASPLTLVGDTW